LFLTMIIGIAGVTAFLYGGLNVYRVSLVDATNDGVIGMLGDFVKCYQMGETVSSQQDYNTRMHLEHFVERQCYAKQLPVKAAMGFAAAFIILALLSAPCAFKKDMWFGFGLWSALAIGLTVVTAVLVGFQALPVASQFVDCKDFSADAIAAIQAAPYNAVCVRSPDVNGEHVHKGSALKWLCKMCTFYGGAIAAVSSLLLMMMIRKCRCCDPNAAPCNRSCNRDSSNCPIRSCCSRLRSRFCSRSHVPLSNQADDSMPVSAPSFYDVNGSDSPTASASEDAGAYQSYSVQ